MLLRTVVPPSMRSRLSLAPFVFSTELARGEGVADAIWSKMQRWSHQVYLRVFWKKHYNCIIASLWPVRKEEQDPLMDISTLLISLAPSTPFQICTELRQGTHFMIITNYKKKIIEVFPMSIPPGILSSYT